MNNNDTHAGSRRRLSGNWGTALAFTGKVLTVENTTFANNTAINGAAILTHEPAIATAPLSVGTASSLVVRGSRFEGNQATLQGGAIWVAPDVAASIEGEGPGLSDGGRGVLGGSGCGGQHTR